MEDRHGNPAIVLGFALMGISGGLAGLLLGWIIWG
jgi:hypothetical protein